MRIVLITGKGGVGKTTFAAATAVAAARRGSKALIVSTDAAHSLGDVLGADLGPDPAAIAPGVDAFHLDGRRELERSWSTIADYLRRLLGTAVIDRLEVDELVVIPGLDELLALARLRSLVEEDRWDAIIVDCAPTADSLRLLSLPDVVSWYTERLFGRRGTLSPWVRRRVERSLAIPTPDDAVLRSVGDLGDELRAIRSLLREATTTARIVTTPEQVVVSEAQRALSYLALYGYATDAILVNRVLGPEVIGTAIEGWRTSQQRQLDGIRSSFSPLPVLCASFASAEPVGLDALGRLGEELYTAHDPVALLSELPALEILDASGAARLRVPVVGVESQDIDIDVSDEDLVITLGRHRRTIQLPGSLRGRKVTGAVVERGRLEVAFGEVVTHV